MGASNPTPRQSKVRPYKLKLTFGFQKGVFMLYNFETKESTQISSFNLCLANAGMASYTSKNPKLVQVWSNWVPEGSSELLTIHAKNMASGKKDEFKGKLGNLAKAFTEEKGGKYCRNLVGIISATVIVEGTKKVIYTDEPCVFEVSGMSFTGLEKTYLNEESTVKSQFECENVWNKTDSYPVLTWPTKKTNLLPMTTTFGSAGHVFVGAVVEGSNPERRQKINALDAALNSFTAPEDFEDTVHQHYEAPQGPNPEPNADEAEADDDLPF
jgi:hypothetical protein